ncbi:Biogenesis of lysosome-related organelles complex 1 subunit 4 [Pseudolycoriella hygida]|uniref:Biogenesis of lysosome-related organelles complex 1 subunit 4 n=1 Tax=Pseudolycoriella hygida TaxID=35572 RepID=A0A9Q0N4C2_9DIPT|nr:Biogenesis of lysosome-related organelles complex 1 subunit 4 [Pseudolycoriella hygida]
MELLEKLGVEYSNYFRQADISKEINPVCTSIDEMLNRLEEFENLVANIKNDLAISMEQTIPDLMNSQDDFNKLCKRIDDLEAFIGLVNQNLDRIEKDVVDAEEELGINDVGIKGFLKPIFGKTKKDRRSVSDDAGNSALVYVPPVIFDTKSFFGSNNGE